MLASHLSRGVKARLNSNQASAILSSMAWEGYEEAGKGDVDSETQSRTVEHVEHSRSTHFHQCDPNASIAIIADNAPIKITLAPNAQQLQQPLPRTSTRLIAVIADNPLPFPKPQTPSYFHCRIIGDALSPICPTTHHALCATTATTPHHAAHSTSSQHGPSRPSHLSPIIETAPQTAVRYDPQMEDVSSRGFPPCSLRDSPERHARNLCLW